jgi:hypothetical protein
MKHGDTILVEQTLSTYSRVFIQRETFGVTLGQGFYSGILSDSSHKAFIGLRQCKFLNSSKPTILKGADLQFDFRISMVHIKHTRSVLIEKTIKGL